MSSKVVVPDHERPDSGTLSSICQLAFGTGLTLYVISFILPAVSGVPTFKGWECAMWALLLPLGHSQFVDNRAILFLCGLINPVLVIYLVLRGLNRAQIVRRLIAIVVLAFIPLNWTYLALSDPPLTPEIGHFAWIAGLLLILVSEAINDERAEYSAPSTAAATSPAPRKSPAAES